MMRNQNNKIRNDLIERGVLIPAEAVDSGDTWRTACRAPAEYESADSKGACVASLPMDMAGHLSAQRSIHGPPGMDQRALDAGYEWAMDSLRRRTPCGTEAWRWGRPRAGRPSACPDAPASSGAPHRSSDARISRTYRCSNASKPSSLATGWFLAPLRRPSSRPSCWRSQIARSSAFVLTHPGYCGMCEGKRSFDSNGTPSYNGGLPLVRLTKACAVAFLHEDLAASWRYAPMGSPCPRCGMQLTRVKLWQGPGCPSCIAEYDRGMGRTR